MANDFAANSPQTSDPTRSASAPPPGPDSKTPTSSTKRIAEGLEAPDASETAARHQSPLESFDAVVKSRRSVRAFLPDSLPDSVLDHCLECALLAPNSSNLQTWDFFVVDSTQKRRELNEACLSQPAATTAARIIVCVAHPHRWKAHAKEMQALLKKTGAPESALNYYGKLIPIAYTAGPLGLFHIVKKLGVAILGLFRPTPREPTSHADMRVWAHKSAALACENLMLALRAHGFDSCPMEGLDSARVRRILGLGRGSEIVMAIGAGKRDAKGIYGPRIRFPKERFIHRI